MGAIKGRPPRRVRYWVNGEVVVKGVEEILAQRDKHDETTVTTIIKAVDALAMSVLPDGSYTEKRRKILHRLAREASPSRVSRTLLGWRDGTDDRILRAVATRQDLRTQLAWLRWA